MSNEIEIVPKSRQVEVVVPSEDLIARIVNQRIAELLTEAQTAELQPFFESREVTEAMVRSRNVLETHKWKWYFEAWGCLICQRKDVRSAGLGMCSACLSRTRERLLDVKRRHAAGVTRQEFKDTVRLAREAVLPSIGNLAQKRREEK